MTEETRQEIKDCIEKHNCFSCPLDEYTDCKTELLKRAIEEPEPDK